MADQDKVKEYQEMAKGIEEDTNVFVKNEDGSFSSYIDLATGTVKNLNNWDVSTWENSPHWEDGIPHEAKEKIRKAMQYYTKDPLVFKSTTLLSQLSNDGFRIRSENKGVEKWFKDWWKDIGGYSFLCFFFKEYFRSGNIPIFKTLIPYIPKKKNKKIKSSKKSKSLSESSVKTEKEEKLAFLKYKMASRQYRKGKISAEKMEEIKKEYAAKKYRWSKKMIPGAYTILNPLSIDITGPENIPWLRRMYLSIDNDVASLVRDPTSKEVKDIIDMLPAEIVSQIKRGEDKVFLPDYLASFITKDKQPYEPWAEPMTTHCFEALDYKYQLRAMDIATVKGVRNRILKVTIGNDQHPCFDPKQLEKLANDFNNPSRNLTLFWNHTLNLEYIEPNLDSLTIEKYEPANEDIRSCFGISRNLTGNTGESLGNNVLNLKGLVEILTDAQEVFLEWFNNEARAICEALSIEEVPEASFGKLNLKDENEYIRVIMQMVDRQIISYETAMETVGFYFPRELKRLKSEQKIREKDNILVPQKAPTQAGADGGATNQGGRPKDSDEKNRPSRDGKSRKPDGEKSVSNLKEGEVESFISKTFDDLTLEMNKISKASEKEEDIDKISLWKNVAKMTVKKFKIEENPTDLLVISLVESKHIKSSKNEKRSFDEILTFVLAHNITNSNEVKR